MSTVSFPLPPLTVGLGATSPCYNVASTRVAAAVKVQPLVVAKNEIYAAPRLLHSLCLTPLSSSPFLTACYVRGL